ncbi:hypothetical protein [Amaricoccus sp.]|uniref:hypothetical protein n=1 Tax=Amaricoccus sp. TaxID=1872485 RepID=UPI001B513147|nr:hypothetical protein [Amaricoccus sp.]MBP7002862.1 hypothetical protein [Amaricoccus sp.]
MTTAVCVGCGAMKFGVLVPCKSCGFVPAEPLDRAYAFALSDHHIAREELEQISRDIIATQTLPSLPPETEAAFVKAYGKLGGA